MMTRDEVIEILALVAAYDRRTASALDVDAWQAVIGSCDFQLARQAVIDHRREDPGVWLEPGHVYQRVRAMRRDQLEREPIEVRSARQEALAAKAAEDIEALAERKGIPAASPTKYQRPEVNPLIVACDWCGAGVGRRCVIPFTDSPTTNGFHSARKCAARAVWDSAAT